MCIRIGNKACINAPSNIICISAGITDRESGAFHAFAVATSAIVLYACMTISILITEIRIMVVNCMIHASFTLRTLGDSYIIFCTAIVAYGSRACQGE